MSSSWNWTSPNGTALLAAVAVAAVSVAVAAVVLRSMLRDQHRR